MNTGKPIPPELSNPIPADAASSPEDLARIRAERLVLLLNYWEIDQRDPALAFAHLAFQLAIKHEPAFKVEGALKRKPGRPRKYAITRPHEGPRQAGRPKRWTTEANQFLATIRKEGEAFLREQGVTRITDVNAIKAWLGIPIDDRSRDRAAIVSHKVAVELAKRLSDARKSVRKGRKK